MVPILWGPPYPNKFFLVTAYSYLVISIKRRKAPKVKARTRFERVRLEHLT
jgi:hypothetical protein